MAAKEGKCQEVEILTKALNEINKLIAKIQKQQTEFEETEERNRQIDLLIKDGMKINQKMMDLL